MKSVLDPLKRHTGLTHTEAIAVAGIALLLLAGWIGRSLSSSTSTHQVESAERVIALLDSMIAQTNTAPPPTPVQNDSARLSRRPSTTPTSSKRRRTTTTTLRVNVNTASSQQLIALPGVGPATARKIIEERNRSPFQQVDDLIRVRGIGPAKLERMRPYVTAP